MTKGYRVGYGRPPAETQFQPGQSGNPKGRAKGSRNVLSLVQKALNETVVVNVNGNRRRISKLEAAFTQQANKAAAGDPRAIRLMLDVLGTATQQDAVANGSQELSADVRRQLNKRTLEALRERLGGKDDINES